MNESSRTGGSIKEWIDTYSDMLLRIAYTHMNNRHDAEDLVQETFIQLYIKGPDFETEIHRKAWLIKVCINLCRNRLKTAWFRKSVPLEDNAFSFTPEENAVMDAVKRLSLNDRTVLVLYYYEGYSLSEMSKMLKCRESTLASRLHRARGRLKVELKEDFDYA